MRAQHLFVAAIAALLATTSAQASVEISANATKNMNCSGGVCAPTAKNAVVNTTDLANMLASSDIKVVTGAGAVTIRVLGSFSWTSSHRLTLDAYYNIAFHAPVVVAGQGAVTITYDDGGTGGDLLFFPGASLDFWDTKSRLMINGKSFMLVKSVVSLVRNINAMPSSNFALATNYDAENDKAYEDCPVTNTFLGSLEGLGHSIQNLTIRERGHLIKYAALFFSVGAGGIVRDIDLINEKVSSSRYDVGGGAAPLAAQNAGAIIHVAASGIVQVHFHNQSYGGGLVALNAGTISDSHSSAAVWPGPNNTGGGLVAYNSGTIEGSDATGSVIGGTAGGLVGENAGPTGLIEESHATGVIVGSYMAGGLAVLNDGGAAISNSFASGPVTGDIAGGLLASNTGTVSSTYATGAVTANYNDYVGGLIGLDTGVVQNSYATGAVSGGNPADATGGLIGEHGCGAVCTVESVYSTGLVNGGLGGGLVGSDEDFQRHDFQSAYWDIDTSGMTQGAGYPANDTDLTGLTDTQLRSGLPVGFDSAIWGQNPSINNGYPYLLAIPPQ